MKASIFIATSLDGFISRPDGDIDWLPVGGSPVDGDYGYTEFIRTVDGLIMGRGTFEKVLTFGTWPYEKRPVVVLSSHPVAIPPDIAGLVEWMHGTPRAVLDRLAARGMKHVYVDGGRTIQGFLAAGVIQRMIITRIPVLIGQGRPLFGELRHDVRLAHVATRTYTNGLVQSEYLVLG